MKWIQRATNGTLTVAILSPTGHHRICLLCRGARHRHALSGRRSAGRYAGVRLDPLDSLISGLTVLRNSTQPLVATFSLSAPATMPYENALMLLARGARVRPARPLQPERPERIHQRRGHAPGLQPVRADPDPRACKAEPPLIHLILSTPAQEVSLVVERIHILAGYSPNTAEITDLLAAGTSTPPTLDERGYIIADDGRTGIAGTRLRGRRRVHPGVSQCRQRAFRRCPCRSDDRTPLDQRRLGLLPT